MITQKKTVVVNVPVQKVYDYLMNPLSLLEYWPSIIDVRDIQKLPNGGSKFNFTYKMAGIRLECTSEDTEIIPNHKMVNKSTGGIDSILTWTLEPTGSGTKMELAVEYNIPIPVIGKLAEAVIVKINEQEANSVAANIKTHLEA